MPALVAISRDRRGDMEVDGLNDDRVNALSNHIFGLRDLVLRVVLSGLDDDRIAVGFGRLLEERHVGMEVPKRRLLFEHEGDLVGLSGRAGALGHCRRRRQRHARA